MKRNKHEKGNNEKLLKKTGDLPNARKQPLNHQHEQVKMSKINEQHQKQLKLTINVAYFTKLSAL